MSWRKAKTVVITSRITHLKKINLSEIKIFMETRAGVKLTPKQERNVKDLQSLLKRWDKDLCINAIAGSLLVMLKGDTKQNKIPEMSETGGFNPDNIVEPFENYDVFADGGDW